MTKVAGDALISRHPERLALLLPSLAAGGVARCMLHLAGAFRDAGYPVDLVLCRAEGAYLDAVPSGVNVVSLRPQNGLAARLQLARLDPGALPVLLRPALLPLRPAPVQPYLADLARYLGEARPAALLSAKTPTNLLALWARRLSDTSTRIVTSDRTQLSHSMAASRKWRWRYIAPLVSRTYRAADAITTVSDGVGDDLANVTNIPRSQITTIYNPVVTAELLHRAAAPAPHPWLEGTLGVPVIVAAGRLAPQKNFPMLLRAFARLRAQRRAKLLILGEGRDRPLLEGLVHRLGLAEDAALPGFVHNPYAAYARASLFVLSSDYEGLGNVLIEALACGCPVVSTNCPSGPSEILQQGRFGTLVEVGDDNALFAAIARALDSPPARHLLQRRGAEFTVARSARRYLELLLRSNRQQSAENRQTSNGPSSVLVGRADS